MKKHKVIDLRTERGRRIYMTIASYYPSLIYGWKCGAEYIRAEGYDVVIDRNGKGYVV